MLPQALIDRLLASATAERAQPVEGEPNAFTVRCRVPFSLPCGQAGPDAPFGARSLQVRAPGDGMPMEPGGEEDPEGPSGEVVPSLDQVVASSTSVDWYGTEMSLRALEGMAEQMRLRPDIVVRGHWQSEWEDVLGKCEDPRVVEAQVRNPYDPAAPGYALVLRVALDPECEVAQRLAGRIKRGQVIGTSIGGWFTEVRFVYKVDAEGNRVLDEYGWEVLERIIVERVELDHLAVTRSPANPDAWIRALRAKVTEARDALRPAPAAEPDREPAPADPTEARVEPPAPETRGATPFADLPLADEDEPWSWTAADQDAVLGDPPDWARYRKATAWYDPEKDEQKNGYKLGIAHDFDGTLRAVWGGVSAAMGALNGARGGVDIPDGDRQGVYNLLKRYYDKFGKEPPELAELSAPAPPEVRSTIPPLDSAGGVGHDTDTTASDRNAEPGGGAAANEQRAAPAPTPGVPMLTPEEIAALENRVKALEEARSQGRRVPRVIVRSAESGFGIRSLVDLAIEDDPRYGFFHDILAGNRSGALTADRATDPTVSAERLLADFRDFAEQFDRRTIQDAFGADNVIPSFRRSMSHVHPLATLTDAQRQWVERALNVSNAGTIVVQTFINRTIEMLTLRELGVQSTLPRRPGQGPGVYVNRRAPGTTNSNTAWVPDTADLDSYEGTGTPTQYTKSYKTLATRGRVTRKLRAIGRTYGDALGNELEGKSEDFANAFEAGCVVGDSGADANSIDGLLTQINAVSGQVVAQTSASAGAAFTLAKLDQAIDTTKGNGNRSDLRIYGSLAGLRRVNAALQAQQRFNDVVEVGAGFRVRSYDGIPLIPSTEIPDILTWSGTAITSFSGGATTALIVVNTRHTWIEELTPMTAEMLAKKSSQYDEFDIFEDVALVCANTKTGTILGGILPNG